jgi:hypothetical protein
MSLDPTALELYVYLPHRDLTIRDAAPCRADPPVVGRFAEQYVGKRLPRHEGEANPGLVAHCAGVLVYAMDCYGLTFEEVCGLAGHEVATVVAEVTPDNRMTEPTRHLKLREALGLASEIGQIVKLAEIAAFTRKALHELITEDYLQHAQVLKHIVDRHGQLLQAMSRLTNQGSMAHFIEGARASLVKISHNVDEARAARVATRQASQGCEAT